MNITQLITRQQNSTSLQPPQPLIHQTQRHDTLNQSFNSHNSGGFTSNQDTLLAKLKQQEKLKEMNQADLQKYIIEADEDGGQIQQVSGGFGDSTNLDEETLKALVQ